MSKAKPKSKAKAKSADATRGLTKRLASLRWAAKPAKRPAKAKAKSKSKHRPRPPASPRAPSKPVPAGVPDFAEQLKIGRHIRVQPTRMPSTIKVGLRFRENGPAKDAHVAALAASINKRGALLEPIVIDADDQLIDGECRLLAWDKSKFAGQPIPIHVVTIDDLIAGEYDANAVRADFRPSELVAIKRAIEQKLGPDAKARQRAGGKRKAEGRVRDIVAKVGGKGARSIEKAEAIVKAAEQDPDKFGPLKDDMDRTGRVDGPYKRLQNIKRGEELRNAPPPPPMSGPYHTVAIDLPWPAEIGDTANVETRGYYPYKTMTMDELAAFAREQIAPVLAKDCAIWLWIPNFHLANGCQLPILEALGVAQASTILTWVTPEIGQGQRLRGASEHAILAIRGKVPVLGADERTWFEAPAASAEHSAKPAKFFEIVEKVTPAPRYAYFFAPGAVPEKWDGHGDRVGKASAHAEAQKADTRRRRPPKAKPDDADPNAWSGHTVTMSIDETVEPPESVATCQCGAVFRVPRDWTGPDEIVARGEEMSRLIAEHRKAAGADGKAQAGSAAAAAEPESAPLPTLELGDKSPPEDVLACLEAIERAAELVEHPPNGHLDCDLLSLTPSPGAIDYLRHNEWIKGKRTLKLTKFGAKHLARLRDLVRHRDVQHQAAADFANRAGIKPPRDTVITPSTHPALFKALGMIGDNAGRDAQTHYVVSERYGEWHGFGLLAIDVALAVLGDQDLKVLCLGQDDEARDIVGRRVEFAAARAFLLAFFDEEFPLSPEAAATLRPSEPIAPMVRAADVRAAADAPVREGPHVIVNAITHAALFKAFETISHDSGAGASATEYPVPQAWAEVDGFSLTAINFALACLDEQELTVFCIGEESEAQLLIERGPELVAAHRLLTAFFEGWAEPTLAPAVAEAAE